MTIVGLIPARAGSKRVPGKNVRMLGGKPLLAWTIEAAKASGIFDEIFVCSDDINISAIGPQYGVQCMLRPDSSDAETDFEWVSYCERGQWIMTDAFAILRPTSPFRSAESIRVAWALLQHTYGHDKPVLDSVRAVKRWDGPHPAKMWGSWGKRVTMIRPWAEGSHPDGTPWHSSPTQSLKPVYVQTGGLEMAWTRVLRETNTISGTRICPLILDYPENIDINTKDDWAAAERVVAQMKVKQ